MIRRLVVRILDAQTGWARPLGGAIQALLKWIFGPLRWLKDFLNGVWLGHALHPLITDVPVGVFTLAVVFDIFALEQAATVAVGFGILAMLGAALAGWADYTDTDGKARDYGTVHQVLMVTALVLYAVSLWLRLGGAAGSHATAVGISWVGYLLVAVGAYVGGELVYSLGNMVDRHAFRSGGSRWTALDVTEIPDGTLTKAKAGAQTLVVVRRGDRIQALHDVCAHAGCSLAEGKLVGDVVECACHGSRYRLADGHVVRGPSTFDQPAYEARAENGRIEVRQAPR